MRWFRKPKPVIERLDVHPGDTLVVTWPDRMTQAGADTIRAAFREQLPDGVKVLVVQAGTKISALRPAASLPVEGEEE